MDISPKTLREVTFREKFRGYHPEDVDTFLERVAVGLEAMQTQLRQAAERVAHAEQLATESATSDEALSRTLLLAQRTADLAVDEAREQAARIVASSEDEAKRIVDEATETARRTAEESQAALRADIERLNTAREELRRDVEVLQRWVDDHRSALSASLQDLLRQLEQGLVARSEPPAATTVDIPEPPAAKPEESSASALHFARVPEPAVEETHEEVGGDGVDTGEVPAATGSEEASVAPADEWSAAASEQPLPEETELAGPSAEAAGRADDEPAEAAAHAGEPEPIDEADDDAFMAELRRAVTDNEPLGPREDVEPPASSDAVAGAVQPELDDFDDSRRFSGRRRRRR
jgi:cell division initiation protein